MIYFTLFTADTEEFYSFLTSMVSQVATTSTSPKPVMTSRECSGSTRTAPSSAWASPFSGLTPTERTELGWKALEHQLLGYVCRVTVVYFKIKLQIGPFKRRTLWGHKFKSRYDFLKFCLDEKVRTTIKSLGYNQLHFMRKSCSIKVT